MDHAEWIADRRRRLRENIGLSDKEMRSLQLWLEGEPSMYRQAAFGHGLPEGVTSGIPRPNVTRVAAGQIFDNAQRKLWEHLNERYGQG